MCLREYRQELSHLLMFLISTYNCKKKDFIDAAINESVKFVTISV